jgi:BNR repeat-containing family member
MTAIGDWKPTRGTAYAAYAVALMALSMFVGASRCDAANDVAAALIQFNANGAWSWFEDERVIVDAAAGKIVVSSVADGSGLGGAARSGDVDVAAYDLAAGAVEQFVLHEGLQDDDHNSAALSVRPDGRYLALYATHGSDALTRYRISSNPGDISSWGAEQTFNNGIGTTYSNLHRLSAEGGRIYNFTRTVGFDPNFLISNDNGETWTYGGRLLDGPGRPYVKYTSNGVDTIHVLNTEQHPRNFDNSVYHSTIRGGEVFDSFGNKIDNLDAVGMSPTAGTRVFAGDADNVAWVSDIHLDAAGRPFVGFTVQKDGAGLPTGQGGMDHRYYYGRFDGAAWHVHEMAYGGTKLYAGEDDYTGNIGLVPDDPNTVYISTDVHPRTQSQLIGADGQRHYELFQGKTNDGGATWSWLPVTFNSFQDNLRPILPAWNAENSALVWMRGTYTTFTNYDLKVVGLVNPEPFAQELALAVDIGETGGLVQSGFAPFTRAASPVRSEQTESFTSPYAAAGNEIEVTLGGGDVEFRDRGENVAGPLGSLAGDFVLLDDGLTLGFGNLSAGDYHLVLYSHDLSFAQRPFDILLDGAPLGVLTPTGGADPLVGIASARVAFSTDGLEDIVLTFDADTSGAAESMVLNGFELYATDRAPFVELPPLVGDLNGDRAVDVKDYRQLLFGFNQIHDVATSVELLARGDLNGDSTTNFSDLVLFRQAYDDFHGAGAFGAVFAAVPEPSAIALAAIAAIIFSPRNPSAAKRRRHLAVASEPRPERIQIAQSTEESKSS